MSLKNPAFIDWGILNTANQGGKNLPGATFSVYKRCWWVYPASRYLIDYMESREGFWLAWALVIQADQDTEADCGCKSSSQASSPLWLWLPQLSQKTQNHVAAYGADRYLSLLFPVLSGVVLNLILSLKLAGVVFSDLAFHEGASFREYLHVGRRITVSHLAYNLLFFLLYTCWVHWIKPKAI